MEWGDDVRPLSEEEAMVIVNHQATGDVCTLMMCLQDKGTVRDSSKVGKCSLLEQCFFFKTSSPIYCSPELAH